MYFILEGNSDLGAVNWEVSKRLEAAQEKHFKACRREIP
jgi:hypothetical protein